MLKRQFPVVQQLKKKCGSSTVCFCEKYSCRVGGVYFDIEFSKLTNSTADSLVIMGSFWACFTDFCVAVLGGVPGEVVELDSSTGGKFSRHVLVKSLLGDRPLSLCLDNNAQAGIIVCEFLSYLRDERARAASPACRLFVHPPGAPAASDKELVPIIDTTVYSRNRCFRLLGQSKFGKSALLRDIEAAGPEAPYSARTIFYAVSRQGADGMI